MANVNQKVFDMVDREIRENPDVTNEELYEKAVELDKGISKLTARQWNARYPLQVKRRLKAETTTSTTSEENGAGTEREEEPQETADTVTDAPKAEKPKSRKKQQQEGELRQRIHEVMIGFAKDVASADSKGDIVDIIAGIDGYVDQVMEAY